MKNFLKQTQRKIFQKVFKAIPKKEISSKSGGKKKSMKNFEGFSDVSS